jgi:membrane fusion protein YbhG
MNISPGLNKKIIPAVIVAILVIGGVSAWLFSNHHGNGSNTLTLYGNVDIRQVQLAFNSNERISQMLVKEGGHVRKGQLLATLNTVSLNEQVRKVQAEAEAARIAAKNAESNYQRAKALVAQHFVAQEQADNARDAYDAAEATLQAAQAALKVARKALADTSLYAPDDGIIQQRILEVGDMASPQHPAYTLALTDPLWVRVYVQETDLGKVKPGMLADVTTDSYPGKHYRAWLGYISPTAEFTPKSVETTEVRSNLVYQARIFVCNPQDELRLGMPATVTIALDQQPAADNDPCKTP